MVFFSPVRKPPFGHPDATGLLSRVIRKRITGNIETVISVSEYFCEPREIDLTKCSYLYTLLCRMNAHVCDSRTICYRVIALWHSFATHVLKCGYDIRTV